jgi:ankyrin repeat protein
MREIHIVANLTLLAVALIAAARPVNAQEADAITLAASRCDTAAARESVASGASAKLRDAALRAAVEVNCKDLAEFLLSAGADINAKEEKGGATPLMAAASRGHADLIRWLLVSGADIAALNDDRQTAVNFAILYGHGEALKILLDYGSDVNTKDVRGNTPLMAAASANNVEFIRWVLSAGAEVDAQNNEGWTALLHASCGNRAEVLKALIAAGADPDVRDARGRTPLMWAAIASSVETIKELISAGVDVNAVGIDRKSAMAYARESKGGSKVSSVEIVTLLKNAGASENSTAYP